MQDDFCFNATSRGRMLGDREQDYWVAETGQRWRKIGSFCEAPSLGEGSVDLRLQRFAPVDALDLNCKNSGGVKR